MTGNADSLRPLRSAVVLAIASLALVAILVAGEEASHHLGALEAAVAEWGGAGVVLFLVLYVVATSLLVPESLLAFVAGAVFGFWWGLAWALAGAVLAALLQYGIARCWLRRRILELAERHPNWRAMRRAVQRDERRLQWLLRLAPFNPAFVSYLLGAFGVDARRFALACLALAPHVAVEVYAGHAARHLAHASHSAGAMAWLHGALLIGGLIVVVAVFHRIGRGVRQALSDAAHEERS